MMHYKVRSNKVELKVNDMTFSVDSLMQAIAQFEGFNKSGSIAQRNNNPGNLRYAPNQTGTDKSGYAIFDSPQEGWNALQRQIGLDQSRGLTLREFIYKYAPPSDNNPTSNYLDYVSNQTGVGADESLGVFGGVGTSSGDSSISSNGISSDSIGSSGEEGFLNLSVGNENDYLIAAVVGIVVAGVVAMMFRS